MERNWILHYLQPRELVLHVGYKGMDQEAQVRVCTAEFGRQVVKVKRTVDYKLEDAADIVGTEDNQTETDVVDEGTVGEDTVDEDTALEVARKVLLLIQYLLSLLDQVVSVIYFI